MRFGREDREAIALLPVVVDNVRYRRRATGRQVLEEPANLIPVVAAYNVEIVDPRFECGPDGPFDERDSQQTDKGLRITPLPESAPFPGREDQALHSALPGC